MHFQAMTKLSGNNCHRRGLGSHSDQQLSMMRKWSALIRKISSKLNYINWSVEQILVYKLSLWTLVVFFIFIFTILFWMMLRLLLREKNSTHQGGEK